ncbi:MAG TPA: FGGY-family carbohydrate kinase [Aggregatilineales bacterium]|nr:FGGY-family carbohydrate kinase [Aggregatilineales bacterium]
MSLLGIDIGTTGCKAMALSVHGSILGTAHREYDVVRPQPGRAELDSQLVWEKIQEVIRDAAAQTAHDPIEAICVSSMGEAMTPVSRDRKILGNCLLGFDIRGAETTARLAELDPVLFFERSGNVVSTIYGGQKLIWLRDHRPELFEQTYKFLGWADLVAYLLGGDPVTDYSLANRSLFFDLRRQDWSPETLAYVGMPIEKLPGLVQAGTPVGAVSRPIAEQLGLRPGIKIVMGAHDQCVNAVGAGVLRPGTAAYGLGTYFCITPVYDSIPRADMMIRSKLNVEHHALPGLYVSFYYNLTGGALLKWFRDTFSSAERAAAQAKGIDVYDQLLAEMPSEPTELLVLPHFAPTGPPYYDDNPNGLITGLTLETTRGEFLKGLLEGAIYYFRAGLVRLAEAGIVIQECRVSGGAARSDAWLQIMADILGRPLSRPTITEAGSLGAAILAGVGGGVYGSAEQAVSALVKVEKVIEPEPRRQGLYDERFARYGLLYPFARQLSGNAKS